MTTAVSPSPSTIRGWNAQGELWAYSRSGKAQGKLYLIRNIHGCLGCQETCEAFRWRGVCQHMRDAARYLETHKAMGEGQLRFWKQTYSDPLRVEYRRQNGKVRPTLESLFGD